MLGHEAAGVAGRAPDDDVELGHAPAPSCSQDPSGLPLGRSTPAHAAAIAVARCYAARQFAQAAPCHWERTWTGGFEMTALSWSPSPPAGWTRTAGRPSAAI